MRTMVEGLVTLVVALALTLLCFAGGMLAQLAASGRMPGAAAPSGDAALSEPPANFTVFYETLGYLRSEFYGETPEGAQLPYAAIRGVLARLSDGNTTFVEPEAHEREREQFQGEFGGIGAQIQLDEEGRLVIVAPIADTPAARAGLQPNDIIETVDGTALLGLTVDESRDLIRGPLGSEVTLGILRGEDERFTLTLTREKIPDPTVFHRMVEGTEIGYIQMTFFSARTADELRAAIADLQAQGATRYIVDLRNNPGGLLSAAIDSTSLFVGEGVVAYQQRRDGSRQEERATGEPILPDAPLVVLINEGSASASEIMAGALNSYERATLVGSTSYGKGTVQIPYTLSDGSSLHVTVAHWLTPNGTDLSSEGLTPDLPVEPTEEQLAAGVDAVYERAVALLQEGGAR